MESAGEAYPVARSMCIPELNTEFEPVGPSENPFSRTKHRNDDWPEEQWRVVSDQ
ncbi:hypothetical protein HNQ56_001205 [Anaerotaenia torta]|uniref:hypothetical protein n=1 Tax=Anaerotaenia torta TaxID=433293 RepID=UPI003D1A59EE